MAVVKANAYGHGAVPVARAALKGGATWLGVSSVPEGIELRKSGITEPILNLGYTPPAALSAAVAAKLSLTIYDAAGLGLMKAAATDRHPCDDPGERRERRLWAPVHGTGTGVRCDDRPRLRGWSASARVRRRSGDRSRRGGADGRHYQHGPGRARRDKCAWRRTR